MKPPLEDSTPCNAHGALHSCTNISPTPILPAKSHNPQPFCPISNTKRAKVQAVRALMHMQRSACAPWPLCRDPAPLPLRPERCSPPMPVAGLARAARPRADAPPAAARWCPGRQSGWRLAGLVGGPRGAPEDQAGAAARAGAGLLQVARLARLRCTCVNTRVHREQRAWLVCACTRLLHARARVYHTQVNGGVAGRQVGLWVGRGAPGGGYWLQHPHSGALPWCT